MRATGVRQGISEADSHIVGYLHFGWRCGVGRV